MDRNEKILLLQLILEDIRGDWGSDLEDRVGEALDLARELELPAFIKSIEEYQEDCTDGYNDGRFFRSNYRDGGYEGMVVLHELESTIIDKSEQFQRDIGILNNPDCRFDDWDDWEGKY